MTVFSSPPPSVQLHTITITITITGGKSVLSLS
jgi:hypothetical protein